ncbi:MAG: undecaprenyl-diphosphate phosphatase [Bacteroidetes bacterium]|nr:undecaprenyl-diphosphate phosphatase [Bacteroidota bacterium]
MSLLQAIILAIIEGLTEFLPVSSTGHIIIGSSVMGISHDEFTKMFTVCVQFGAILAVVVMYVKRFFRSLDFYYKLFIAFLPAAIIGKLFGDQIDMLLENVLVVAITLLGGGVVFLFIDRWFQEKVERTDSEPSYFSSFIIGCFQCIAMIPGVSRSAATIIGGLVQKMTRKSAAEFSFFLAVPTIFAASVYKLYHFFSEGGTIGKQEIILLGAGNLVAFIVAILAIKFFIYVLVKYGFKFFGWYRIAAGLIILALYFSGKSIAVF